jgi:hypothetical protein
MELIKPTTLPQRYPTSFFYEVHAPTPLWRLYHRYVPAGSRHDARMYGTPPVSFPLDAGAAISVNHAVLPVLESTGDFQLASIIHGDDFCFLGVMLAEDQRWALVQSIVGGACYLAPFNGNAISNGGKVRHPQPPVVTFGHHP